MTKGYKIRIYPNKAQEELIKKHIDACRFMWNYMLNEQHNAYEETGKRLSRFDMIYKLKPMKQDEKYKWLNDVSNSSLVRTCTDLDKAYQFYFKRINKGLPKHRSARDKKRSYPVCTEKFYISGKKAYVQKVGFIRYKTDFDLPEGRDVKFIDVRITAETDGRYMLSFCLAYDNQIRELNDYSMGIDLGIKELAVVAYGDEQLVFHNINKSRQIRKIKEKIRHTQRGISRKHEASKKRNGKYTKTKNIMREETKLRKLHRRIVGIRNNYNHQSTARLVSLLPSRVVMEDLNVIGMMKNRHLSRAVSEQCLYDFMMKMKYKCEWNGIEFVIADRYYPSSKTCSCCGSVKKDLKLSDRTYRCEACGLVIDRDYNAAINLMRYEAQFTRASA